jgi:surface carbohydrate biosynthesis protein (TIGR04326 family)
VGANNNLSKARFLENGFNSKQTLKIEAQRYNYLIKNSDMLNQKISKIRKSILISTSTNYKETKELLETFFLSNIVFEKVYIKEHPHMPVRSIIDNSIKGFPPYELVEGSVQNAFKLSDIVYVANSSSVLLESVLSKKHTVSLISLSTLPMPAIDKAPNLYFVEDENSLSNTLTQLTNEIEIDYTKNAVTNDLYLDKELSLWRKFLKI